MSGEWEFDPYEYAEELAAGEDLGRSDLSSPERAEGERGRMSRRELLARGGAGAAAIGGLGAFAGPAAAASGGSSEVDANGKFTGTLRVLTPRRRVPDPGHREAGLQGPRLHGEADPRDSEKQPQIAITSPDTFDVFGGYNYQSLQVWPSGGLQPLDTRKLQSLEGPVQAVHARQAQPGVGQVHVRRGQRAVPDDVRRSGRLDRPAARSPTARRATSRSSAGSARTASRSAGSRSPAASSAPPRTSTPTRWATTPT